jgi:hypothetical protein|tara:strand:- start:199 stop:666 length:468 start_codon:yes stop_codon:yes gene_type:complete
MTRNLIENLQISIDTLDKYISLQEIHNSLLSELKGISDETSFNLAIKLSTLSQEKITSNKNFNSASKNFLECLKSNTPSFIDPNNLMNDPKSIEARYVMSKCSTSMNNWKKSIQEYDHNELEQDTQFQGLQNEVQEFCKMSGDDAIVTMLCSNLV